MNVHHLELFYYVARHGGISQAVRNMPYGIQQPAMSGQIIHLEEFLGVTLFQRRPFQLTAAGEDLYRFIGPFFSNINSTADRLRGGVSQQIRVGASQLVLRNYIPTALRAARKKFPKLKMSLREGYQHQLEAWLQDQELDLAVTALDVKPPPGMKAVTLLTLPMVLLVPQASRVRAAEELWARDRIEETLISLPADEVFCRNFQAELFKRKVDWFPGIEVSSLELIETYVAAGEGLGLSVAIPKIKHSPQVRMLPLAGFPPMCFGVLWQGKLTPIAAAVLEEIQTVARTLAG